MRDRIGGTGDVDSAVPSLTNTHAVQPVRLALAEHKLRRAIMLSKVSADNGNYAIAPDGLTINEAESLLAALATAEAHEVEHDRALTEALQARDAALAALKCANQFIHPGIDRGPAINGWENTVSMVDAVLKGQP